MEKPPLAHSRSLPRRWMRIREKNPTDDDGNRQDVSNDWRGKCLDAIDSATVDACPRCLCCAALNVTCQKASTRFTRRDAVLYQNSLQLRVTLEVRRNKSCESGERCFPLNLSLAQTNIIVG